MGVRYLLSFMMGLFVLGSSLSAQSTATIRQMADLQFKHEKYRQALDNYNKLLKEKPNDDLIKYRLGVCHLYAGQIQTAEQYLLYATSLKGGEKDAWYYLGRLYHLESNFKEAISYYKKYMKEVDGGNKRSLSKHYIRQCAFSREIKYQEEKAIVDNLGSKVNGFLDDYAPIISPGRESTIYFSSSRPGTSGGMRDSEGVEDEIIGQYNSDIFSSQLINGEWTATRPLNELINSSKNDEVIGFSDRSTVMYYYKGYIPTRDGAIYTDTLKSTKDEFYYPSTFRSPVNVREGDEAPFIFKDSTIIYASSMEGGYGGLDLYVIKRLPGGFWTRPENLGPEVNSPYDDTSPFLARNGRTLYYSSNRPYSLGGFDIFKTTFRDDLLVWTTPENMGAPINSPGDELSFTLSKDGLKSFLASDRVGGMGGFDIYIGYFKAVQSEQSRDSYPYAFNLIDKTKKPISGGAITPKPDTPIAPVGNDTEERVVLSPLFYSGDNIVTKANMSELNKVVKLALKYPNLKIELNGHTDDNDPEKFRLYFSYLRAQKAADYLKNNGVAIKNIYVKGFGSSYPVARNQNQDGSDSPNGRKLNRRIEIRIINGEGTNVISNVKWPIINERQVVYQRATYDNSLMGLSYKVQVAALRSMYDSDVILKYKDPMIEQDAERNLLRYTIGLHRSYSMARSIKNELKSKGVQNAFIVPYVDGVRLKPEEAQEWVGKYSDLNNFIQGW